MKVKILALVCLLALIILGFPVVQASPSAKGKVWAVIVCAYTSNSLSTLRDEARYLYKVLTTDYNFNDKNIYYLSSDASQEGVDDWATKLNVRSAFTIWLRQRSTSLDTVLVYILCHGGGYSLCPAFNYNTLEGGNGRIEREDKGDEGEEINETFYGKDVNGDGDKDDWFGSDECIILHPYYSFDYEEYYWDDELAADLSMVSYWRLILVDVGCFSGGFIDDLSAPNRIIITPTNETYPSLCKFQSAYGGPYNKLYDISFWGEQFISALDKGTESYGVADVNKDGRVSIWEAFQYAYEHDPAVQGVYIATYKYNPSTCSFSNEIIVQWMQETPWLDDNGNGLPTFREGKDCLDTEEGELADGFLASHTYLGSAWSPDINGDGIVSLPDIQEATGIHWLSSRERGGYAPNADLDGNGVINIIDLAMIARNWGWCY